MTVEQDNRRQYQLGRQPLAILSLTNIGKAFDRFLGRQSLCKAVKYRIGQVGKLELPLPSGHMVPKWCCIDVDATSSRRIDVNTTDPLCTAVKNSMSQEGKLVLPFHSGHMVPKWCIDVVATSQRRINVNATSFLRRVPFGLLLRFLKAEFNAWKFYLLTLKSE